MEIRAVNFGDWGDWIALAKEMEPLFQGKMAENTDFHTMMRRKITREEAVAAVDETARCIGIIAVSRKNNVISWFAIKKECRGKGVGTRLLFAGLELLNRKKPIAVTTFRDGYSGGAPARRVYQKFGFRDFEEVMHHGQPRSLMVRNPVSMTENKSI